MALCIKEKYSTIKQQPQQKTLFLNKVLGTQES